jgi:uncharacterized protein (DUF58 family)
MLPRELLKKVRKIEIRTSRLVDEQLAGQYHSIFKGRGMAFDEVRPYQVGDDVRFIDWNVSARFGDTFVKVFTEEREAIVMLVVDFSASMRFASHAQPKIEIAAELSALLAFSAIRNDDQVGLVAFTDRVVRFVPPKKGRKHVLRVVTEILRGLDGGAGGEDPRERPTDVGGALDFLNRVSKHRSIVFLISDFLGGGFERAVQSANARHDLIPIVLRDGLEEVPPAAGLVPVEDPETGELVFVDLSSRRTRETLGDTYLKMSAARDRLFRRNKIDFLRIRTDQPYLTTLRQFFRIRERRARSGR